MGYSTILHKTTNLLIVGNAYETDSSTGIGTLNNLFGVEIRNNFFIVDYAIGQIPIEKEFKTIEELLKFVRQVFPLEE
ncbi:hypothetical protein [uncultured Chryseobacterium sp.]|uniref:hypothetical protein n=1 Tax=uncultured Chryseobacterium sp. TaxID=259322 RepID=UPI002583BBAF|nr:hypothetical protein [uncultured Chryseobacterium sp.]